MLLTPTHRGIEVNQISGNLRQAYLLAEPKFRIDPLTGLLTAVNEPAFLNGPNGSHLCDNNTFKTNFAQWFDDTGLWLFETDPLQEREELRSSAPVGLTLSANSLNWVNAQGQSQTIATPQHVGADRNGQELYYTGAFGPGLDMKFTNSSDRVRKDLVIASRGQLPSPTNPVANGTDIKLQLLFKVESFNGDINLDGIVWDRTNTMRGRRSFAVLEGYERFGLAPPIAETSEPNDEHPQVDLEYVFIRKGSNIYVGVECPLSWLDDPSHTFPVFVDLTETWGENTVDDYTSVMTCASYRAQGDYRNANAHFYEWSSSGGVYCYETLAQFDLSVLDGATISAATYNFKMSNHGGSDTRYWYQTKYTDAVPDEAHYNLYKTGGSWASSYGETSGTDYYAGALWSTSIGGSDEVYYSGSDFASALQSVLASTTTLTAHVLRRGSGATDYAQCYGYTATTGKRPYLDVTYTAASTSRSSRMVI